MKKEKAYLAWGGGISSAVTLYEIKSPEYRLTGIFSSVTAEDDLLLGHRIPRALIESQALALDEKIKFITVANQKTPFQSQEEETAMAEWGAGVVKRIAVGTSHVGTSHQGAVAACQSGEMRAIFPLWNWPSKEVSRVFLMLGFQALVIGIDSKRIPASFLGRVYDKSFVDSLPAGVDPIGDNGEFQTFVANGPFFQSKVDFKKMNRVQDGDWAYIPLLPS